MGNFPKNNSFLTYRLKKTPQGYFSLRGLDVSKERNHHATKGCKVKIAFDKTLNNNALYPNFSFIPTFQSSCCA